MRAPSIFIKNATLAFNNSVLFQDLNLTFVNGKFTCLLGPSGVGKTTLLRMIANLFSSEPETQFHGDIFCDGETPLAQQISYMAQTDLLMPWLSALDNAILHARLQGQVTTQLISRAKDLFAQVGLQDVTQKFPRELSGGMRQRVALVRTLLQDKPIVLMDEPFAAVDAITRFQLQTLAAELLKNRTVLLVTHDPTEALRLADEIFILAGRPAVLSAPLDLITSTPRDPSNSDFIKHQAELYHALLQAKEIS